MNPSSHRKASWSPDRFYDYLKCLQKEFEHRLTNDMSSPRRFNIYVGNLKGEFELMSLEIESLQKERDEYRERVEVQMEKRQGVCTNIVCERCNKGTSSASQIAIPSRPKIVKTGPRLFFQSKTLRKPRSSDSSKDVNITQETTTHQSSQHTSLIQKIRFAITPTRPSLSAPHTVTKDTETPITLPSPLPRSSDSTFDRPKEPGQMIEFSNEVEKELDVEIVHTLFHAKQVRCVKFSRDGKYLAAGCKDGKAYIYDVQEGTLTNVLRDLLAEDDRVRDVCFSPDGKYLATGAWDGRLYIWEINRKYVRNAFKGHTSHIMSLDFSPNGRLLVSASGDNTLRLWNMHDGATRLLNLNEENTTFINEPFYSSAIFSPNGRYVAASHSDGMVRIWDVCTGQLVRRIKAHVCFASSVAFMPDGKGLVSLGWDYRLRYWDVSFLDFIRFRGRSQTMENSHGETLGTVKTWGPEREFLGHERFVYSLAISPDGRWVSSGCKSIHIWDTHNAAMQCTLSGHDADSDLICPSFVDFCPTGRYLASGGNDGVLKIWRYSSVVSGDSLVHELGQ